MTNFTYFSRGLLLVDIYVVINLFIFCTQTGNNCGESNEKWRSVTNTSPLIPLCKCDFCKCKCYWKCFGVIMDLGIKRFCLCYCLAILAGLWMRSKNGFNHKYFTLQKYFLVYFFFSLSLWNLGIIITYPLRLFFARVFLNLIVKVIRLFHTCRKSNFKKINPSPTFFGAIIHLVRKVNYWDSRGQDTKLQVFWSRDNKREQHMYLSGFSCLDR